MLCLILTSFARLALSATFGWYTLWGASAEAADWASLFPHATAQPSIVAPGAICSGDDESHASVHPDGRRLYFLKNTPSFDFYTIVYSDWSNGTWTRPRTAPFSGQFVDADISFTPDGRRAYFVSSRPVNGQLRNDMEIWTIESDTEGRWGQPRHVTELSSPTDEWFPIVTAQGTLYFGSGRSGGVGGSDIWRARSVNGTFQPPENLGRPVNTPGDEIEAFVTEDERLMIIAARNRGDALGAYDIYVTRRGQSGWGIPRNPGAPINSPAWELAPQLSPDGKVFLFTSNRGFGSTPLKRALSFEELEGRLHAPGNGVRDIYVVRSEILLR